MYGRGGHKKFNKLRHGSDNSVSLVGGATRQPSAGAVAPLGINCLMAAHTTYKSAITDL